MTDNSCITLESVMYVCRAYESGDSFHEYRGSANIFVSGHIATIYAANGKLTKKDYKDLFAELRKKDIAIVRWERHKNGESVFSEKNIIDLDRRKVKR